MIQLFVRNGIDCNVYQVSSISSRQYTFDLNAMMLAVGFDKTTDIPAIIDDYIGLNQSGYRIRVMERFRP